MAASRRSGRIALLALAALAFAAIPASADGVASAARIGGCERDDVRAMVVDADGATWIAGSTSSDDFPVASPLQESRGGMRDAFVAKIAADGTTVLFATYLGGTEDDEAAGIALDAAGRVVVAGTTSSADFPMANALQWDFAGERDAFVAVLSADGSSLEYSTFLGGTGNDVVTALAVDAAGRAWIGGETGSLDLPTTADGIPAEDLAFTAGFVACVPTDGSPLRYGGLVAAGVDALVRALAPDASGGVFVAGIATAADYPQGSALKTFTGTDHDAFVARFEFRFDYDQGIEWYERPFLSFLGGSGDDGAAAVAVDSMGKVWVAGATASPDFPAADGTTLASAGGSDAFVSGITADGATLLRSDLVGGTGDDSALAVVLDGNGDRILAGTTGSDDFPAVVLGGPVDHAGTAGYVMRLGEGGLNFASLLDGAADDGFAALALGADGSATVAGATESGDPGPFSAVLAGPCGGGDGLLARLPTVLAAPVNFAAADVRYDGVTLSWEDAAGGVASFEIERKAQYGAWENVASVPEGSTAWEDTSVASLTRYDYRVRAIAGGFVSEYSSEIEVSVPRVPVPGAPGNTTAVAETPWRVRVRWQDLSETETHFHVFRSVDGGTPVLAKILFAGTTEWVDNGVIPDREWTYRVSAVGVSGTSMASAPATVATEATLGLELIKGKRKDGRKVGRDSVSLRARLLGMGGTLAADLRADGLEVGVGPETGGPVLVIPAGDLGWKEKRAILTWKSPKGSATRATVRVDTATGEIRIKVSRLELPLATADAVRVWFRCGLEAGSCRETWVAKSKGTVLVR